MVVWGLVLALLIKFVIAVQPAPALLGIPGMEALVWQLVSLLQLVRLMVLVVQIRIVVAALALAQPIKFAQVAFAVARLGIHGMEALVRRLVCLTLQLVMLMLLALQELMVAVDLVLALLIKFVQAVLALAQQGTLGMEALV